MVSTRAKELIDYIYYFGCTMQDSINELTNLEINGKIESAEYQQNLSIIYEIREHITKKIEQLVPIYDEVYDYTMIMDKVLDHTSIEDTEISGVINTEDNSFNFLYNTFVNYSYENRIISRYEYSYDDLNETEEEFEAYKEIMGYDEDDYDDEEYELVDPFERSDELEKMGYDITYLKNRLFLFEFMSRLERLIAKEENTSIKNKLITIKYRLIYANPSLLERLIHVPEKIYNTDMMRKLLKNYYETETPDVKCIFEMNYSNGILEEIEKELLNIGQNTSEDLKNDDKKVTTYIDILSIQAIITLLFDEFQIDSLHSIKRKALSNAVSDTSKALINKALIKTIS